MDDSLVRLDMCVPTREGDLDGFLVVANERLVAIFVQQQKHTSPEAPSWWRLEAGFRPCSVSSAPAFDSPHEAQQWVRHCMKAGDRE